MTRTERILLYTFAAVVGGVAAWIVVEVVIGTSL